MGNSMDYERKLQVAGGNFMILRMKTDCLALEVMEQLRDMAVGESFTLVVVLDRKIKEMKNLLGLLSAYFRNLIEIDIAVEKDKELWAVIRKVCDEGKVSEPRRLIVKVLEGEKISDIDIPDNSFMQILERHVI